MPGSVSRREALSLTLAASTLTAAAPAWAAQGDVSATTAHGVLTRLFGGRAAGIALNLTSHTSARPWYAAGARGGKLSIRGDSGVALTRGAYAWLRQAGAAHVSWEGDRVALPARWTDGTSGRVESPFAHRAYLNPCTFGYTTPWWDWPRWRREIDWMAVHGIDMPLALEGQEFVWRALWREEGLTEAELAGYFSGPAFTPWQRMGNIEGYRAPLPAAWIDKKRDLQRQILGAMRALGMDPILPAFGGYVPKAFALKHREARIYKMPAGGGFHETYWLDPGDPLFARLTARFLALYTESYGAGTYYLADSFNEMRPPPRSIRRSKPGASQPTARRSTPPSTRPGPMRSG
jgi:alpha-N-acetylglucosaminidase